MGKFSFAKTSVHPSGVLLPAAAISSPAQSFTTLDSFNGTDGNGPVATLIRGVDGNFYGTTSSGGANGNFRLGL